MIKKRHLLTLALLPALAGANPQPYDEAADAKAQVAQTLAAAKKAGVPMLLVFGANWCEDCRALDAALQSDQNARLMAREFKVLKVDVGRFDKNLDVVAAWGDAIKKGIPAAVIVSPAGQVVYATRAGELANARKMSATGVFDFFSTAATSHGAAAAKP
jgi:protein disulfide-isomerase